MRVGVLPIGVAAAGLLAGATATSSAQDENGLRAAATGFFHFERIGDVDWAIAPDGRAMTLAGVDFVNPHVFHSSFLGYAPYRRFVETNYPSLSAWADETAGRLRSWGFNMLASHCATDLFPDFPHAETLNLNNPFAKSKDPEWRIAENTDAPSTGFPNVFHPDYEREVFAAAAKRCAPLKDDSSLVGWFIDNELNWWGGSSDMGAGLFDLVAKLPPEHSARKALAEWLDSKCNRQQSTAIGSDWAAAVPRDTKVGFLQLIAERYFSINAAAIRAADPNHAILGCRFARGTTATHEVVWREAGRHCDVVSLNCYPWCDLDRGVVLTDQGGLPLLDELRRVHDWCGRPMMVTEWSFPALDTGRPCLHGAGQRFHTQSERAAAVELFARTLLSEPYIVGHDWFMWVDQPAAGLRPALPEDSNYGLVSERGEPYALVTETFARVHAEAFRERRLQACDDAAGRMPALPGASAGRMPALPGAIVRDGGSSERERFFAAASAACSTSGAVCSVPGTVCPVPGTEVPGIVGFRQAADGSWTLSNGLVRLCGRIGGSFMADEIAFCPVADAEAFCPVADAEASAYRPAGRFRTLLQRLDGTRRLWTDTDCVTDVSFTLDDATGVGSVTIRAVAGTADNSRGRESTRRAGSQSQAAFAMTASLSIAPGRNDVLAEIVSAENLSDRPLFVERVFMRPFAVCDRPDEIPSVPKLWRGPHEGWWTLPDGRRFGMVSRDRASCSCRFYVGRGGEQHPDAPFVEDGPFEIAPGATWTPSSPMGAVLATIEKESDGNR